MSVQTQQLTNDHYYPAFNDTSHDRPILADSGGTLAAVILLGTLLGTVGLTFLLTIL
jgi:hypothetical protein